VTGRVGRCAERHRRFGKLDILIANAGAVTAFTPSENLPFASSAAEGLISSFHQSVE
jgi:NAD(P)-dependent dehydrogenase (short-subunit alcohol dehydrogenase family)